MAKQAARQKIHSARSLRSKASPLISRVRSRAAGTGGPGGAAKRAKKAPPKGPDKAPKNQPNKTREADRSEKALREHLLYLLGGGGAHVDFEKALADLSPGLRGKKVPGFDQSVWRLLEHMRIAQWDILEFSTNQKHVSPEWTAGYWPPNDAPPDEKAWRKSIDDFRADLQAMRNLVSNPKSDLFAPIPHGDGQTRLREALLAADHNAYHLGQIVLLRRLLGAWPE